MKWRKRQRELERLRTKYAGNPYLIPLPNLTVEQRGVAPCSNRFDSIHDKSGQPMKQAICSKCGKKFPHQIPDDADQVICFDCANPGRRKPIVDHFHKSGLQVILPDEIKDMGGKKL